MVLPVLLLELKRQVCEAGRWREPPVQRAERRGRQVQEQLRERADRGARWARSPHPFRGPIISWYRISTHGFRNRGCHPMVGIAIAREYIDNNRSILLRTPLAPPWPYG